MLRPAPAKPPVQKRRFDPDPKRPEAIISPKDHQPQQTSNSRSASAGDASAPPFSKMHKSSRWHRPLPPSAKPQRYSPIMAASRWQKHAIPNPQAPTSPAPPARLRVTASYCATGLARAKRVQDAQDAMSS